MTTTPTIAPAPEQLERPRSQHHLVEQGTDSRITACGLIPPWDLDPACSAGTWAGERHCHHCGEPICPRCLAIADEARA